MILLRSPALKANGLKSNGWWYVAREFPDGTFTITMNKSRAKDFKSEAEADAFNQGQLNLDHLSKPFEIYECK